MAKSENGKQGRLIRVNYIIELSEEDYMMYSNDEWNVPLELVDALKKATPIREGRWKKTGGLFPDDRRLKCSECGYDSAGLRDFEEANYCPKCGIKLQKKTKMTFEIHSADDFEKVVRTIMRENEEE